MITHQIVYSWFTYKNIISDTVINDYTYFKIDDGNLIRSGDNTIYSYDDSKESIYFNFNVKVGDVVSFENRDLKVTELKIENIFGENVQKITVSNQFSSSDTLISYSFTKKYGIYSSLFKISGSSSRYYLAGAIIDSVAFGRL